MHHLYREKRTKEIDSKFYVFDVETKKLKGDNEKTIVNARPENFVFGCIYGKAYRRVFYSLQEWEEIITDPRFSGAILFAHNAEYDLLSLYGDIFRNLDAKSIFNGRFICARRHKFIFADSYNIFGFSVKEIGRQIGLEKLEIADDLISGTIKDITHRHIEYCFRDCQIIWDALRTIFEITGAVKITLAGLALKYYRNSFMEHGISYDEEKVGKFFESYYGGRVEAFKIGKVRAYKYDINSMYPYAMRECVFPNPKYLKTNSKCSVKLLHYYLERYEGMAKLTVRHEKTKIGYLPFRRDGKLIFPVGVFTGIWNYNELRFALERKVITILKVHETTYGPPYESPFKKFVNEVYAKRIESTGIYKTIYKLILNSLYGKFAQRLKWSEEYFTQIPIDQIRKLAEKRIKFEIRLFNTKRKDGFLRTESDETFLHTIPIFSSYITSFSRVHLLKYMLRQEKYICYVDTDSLCISRRGNYDSTKLGELKKEPVMLTEIKGNKSYTEITDDKRKIVKLKGVPGKATTDGKGRYEYQKMIKTREALARGITPGVFNFVTKNIQTVYDKRTISGKGKTNAIILSEDISSTDTDVNDAE